MPTSQSATCDRLPEIVTGQLRSARSVADLPLAGMRWRPLTVDQGVWLDASESKRIVSTLSSAAETAADRIAANARRRTATVSGQLFEILTSKRFRKGAKENLPHRAYDQLVDPYVRDGEPIPVVTFGFPAKIGVGALKTTGPLADLAELAALVRFHELQLAARAVYPPGLRISILSDGNHFRPRPTEILAPYQEKLADYQRLVGVEATVHDLDQLAADRLTPAGLAEWAQTVDRFVQTLTDALDPVDVTVLPGRALAAADRVGPRELGERADGTPLPVFSALFRSLLHTVPLPSMPRPMPSQEWARQLQADIYQLADPVLGKGRSALLGSAWTDTIRYLAAMAADRELSFEKRLLPYDYLRLTPHPRPGSIGFGYLGGSCILPWHGVGVAGPNGVLSCEYTISAADAGYLPVWSELLGTGQPWFMAPPGAAAGGKLDAELLSTLRLRRR